MSTAGADSLPAVTGNIGNSPHVRAGSESYPGYRQLLATGTDDGALTLAVPPELIDAIAERVTDMLAERQPQPAPELLTVDEAAEFLRCRRQRLYDLVSQDRLPHLKDGSRVLIRRVDLLAYLGDGGAA